MFIFYLLVPFTRSAYQCEYGTDDFGFGKSIILYDGCNMFVNEMNKIITDIVKFLISLYCLY